MGEHSRRLVAVAGRPDASLSLAKYREHADDYDLASAGAHAVRARAVRLLDLCPGDVVLDVGCGTGLNFGLIAERIGPEGRIVGIELCGDMLAQAQERLEGCGCGGKLVESAAEEADIAAWADAALFSYTHDIVRSPAALENVFGHLRPGALVASAGLMQAPWWSPLGGYVERLGREYATTLEGFDRPWTHLERFLPYLEVEEPIGLGGAYVAWGKVPRERRTPLRPREVSGAAPR